MNFQKHYKKFNFCNKIFIQFSSDLHRKWQGAANEKLIDLNFFASNVEAACSYKSGELEKFPLAQKILENFQLQIWIQ